MIKALQLNSRISGCLGTDVKTVESKGSFFRGSMQPPTDGRAAVSWNKTLNIEHKIYGANT